MIAYGSTEDVSGSNIQSNSEIRCRFVLAGSTAIRVEHQCSVTVATVGLGNSAGFTGNTEIYTSVELWKVA